MSDEEQKVKGSLLYLARKNQAPGQHPTSEELVDYHTGRLPPEKSGPLQDHLVLCEECRSLLLDLADYPDLSVPEGTLPDFSKNKVEEAFRATWAKLADTEPVPFPGKRPGGPAVPSPPSASWASSRIWMPLAAILLFGCLGLSFRVLELDRTVEKLEGPRLNVALADLFPEGSAIRGTDEASSLEIPASQSHLTVVLHLDDAAAGAGNLGIRILDHEGRELWGGVGLTTGPGHTATLTWPRSFLPPGDYRLLVGEASGEISEAYRIRIVWP